jgi:hypothetical protein
MEKLLLQVEHFISGLLFRGMVKLDKMRTNEAY